MATEAEMIEALRQVIDPELMINIVDLGLVYSIDQEDSKATVEMTLTSPACPVGPQLVHQAKMALEGLEGIEETEIKLVMTPPWSPDRMTDEVQSIALGSSPVSHSVSTVGRVGSGVAGSLGGSNR